MIKQTLAVLILTQLLFLGQSLIGNAAFAHDHDEFPEGTLLALEGADAISKEECSLFVMDVGYTGPEQTDEQWYASVLTSYNHNGASASSITVRKHPTRPGALTGVGANGEDEIAIFLEPQDLDLRNAKSFNLKWRHDDHFHTNRCLNLEIHKD
jgi:hypothetical protein